MPTQMNEACTLKTRQMVKNPVLMLSVTQKDVCKYKKVAAAYGNVAPVVVSAPIDGGYLMLAGSARLEAYVQTGINEAPAIVTQTADEIEQLKLSLMLSSIRDEGGALSEGALISTLINKHAIAPRELCNLLGRSKAWVSKRMALDQNLIVTVKKMVTDGTLCPRSAEEVAKLPGDVQAEFAANAVNHGLNKTEISQLVACYRSAFSDEVRKEIVKSPLEALSKIGLRIKRKSEADINLNGPGRRLKNCVNYAVQMILKAVNMVENANEDTLRDSQPQLIRLQDVVEETDMILSKLLADVSLGKLSCLEDSHSGQHDRTRTLGSVQTTHPRREQVW